MTDIHLDGLGDVKLELTAHHHAPGLYQAVEDHRVHLSQFLTWPDHMRSAADFESYIDRCIQMRCDGTEYSFVIIENDRVAGRVGMHHMDQQNHYAEIGYWLIPPAEGRGIITIASGLIADYGFRRLGLQRIAIKAAVPNTRSRAVAERLGF